MLNVGQLVTFTYIAWQVASKSSLKTFLAESCLPDARRFADRFGRKTSFYLAWIWLVVVNKLLDMIVGVQRAHHCPGMCLHEHRQIVTSMGKDPKTTWRRFATDDLLLRLSESCAMVLASVFCSRPSSGSAVYPRTPTDQL